MSIENRPYVGTWKLDSRELVQHTPDALVYVNGDTTLPGCPKCNGRIDIQRFITEVSVDAGVDPGSASASFTLSIPLHHHDSFARDAKFLLTPGLEIHVYMRGYFPVKGMFLNLANGDLKSEIQVSTHDDTKNTDPDHEGHFHGEKNVTRERKVVGFGSRKRKLPLNQIVIHESVTTTVERTEKTLQAGGNGVHYMVGPQGDAYSYVDPSRATGHAHSNSVPGMNDRSVGVEVVNGYYSNLAKDQVVIDTSWSDRTRRGPNQGKRQYAVPPQAQMERLWCTIVQTTSENNIPLQFPTVNGDSYTFGKRSQQVATSAGIIAHHDIPGGHGDGAFPVLYMVLRERGYNTDEAYRRAVQLAQQGKTVTLPPRVAGAPSAPPACNPPTPRSPENTVGGRAGRRSRAQEEPEVAARFDGVEVIEPEPFEVEVAPSLLDEFGLGGKGIENMLNYPYYHVFHGVVTQVGHSWSGGVNTVTVSVVSMLHFWQYHTMSTNASVFGARPSNSKLKTSMVGHNFTGMHPFQIIYTLHHDMVGAAGGVGWALSSKTNQSAFTEDGGESLFSLNIRYWEKRFSQRMIKLRMHGASGELFSAAQSTFLGRNSSDTLKTLVQYRFSDPSSRRGRAKEIMEDSISVGLFNRRKLEALLFARSTNGNANSKGGTKFELNLAEMQAFVSNIGNWGQPAFFESAYESKLDIAQKVMEITGFEFYQDVDGDFVFKPPMYNLDTSSSRIYRIEDIDLISISTDEKEPQATYATVKGSQFKNLQGTGVENEWGVKGQYIDHRLVAQFGWRPVQYETAYFNDPKSMFFSAINRLDIMNAPSKAAQVTIPLRPEIRPGYPVFIPYLDSFYYCNGLSHSFSVGGQCTTNLQLIGKRSKFYAPGLPNQEGIDAIDLENTTLPARPLEVTDLSGHPRLSGFPNVVMALDPDALNPLFWVVGADIERLDDPVVLRNILRMGGKEGIDVVSDKGNGVYVLTVPTGSQENGDTEATEVEFFLRDDPRLPEEIKATRDRKKRDASAVPESAVDIVQAGRAYVQRKEQAGKRIDTKLASLVTLQSQLNSLESRLSRETDEARKKSLRRQKAAKQDEIRQARKEVEAIKAETENSFNRDQQDGVFQLTQLIKIIGERYFLQDGSDLRRIPETHSLLDMLSDKKAILSNGTQPGRYRYYSASHPDPQHQGQKVVEYSNPPDGQAAKIVRKNSFLDPEWQGTVVQGYVRTPNANIPGVSTSEATLGEVRPTRGIKVLTSDPAKPNGEVVPTSQIKELMFSVQDMTQTKGSTDNAADNKVQSLGDQAAARFRQRFRVSVSKVSVEDPTALDLFVPVWSEFTASIPLASVAADRKARELDGAKRMPLPSGLPTFPSAVLINPKFSLDTSLAISEYKLSDTSGTKSLGGKVSKMSTRTFTSTVLADKLANLLYQQFGALRGSWAASIRSEGYSDVHVDQIVSEFNAVLAARWKVPVRAVPKTSTNRKSSLKRKIHSPVFPVSDAKGYEVVGSYRYGRGVDIEPGGVWDSLHAQDPLQFLDRKTVEDIVDAVVSGKAITVERERKIGNKTVKEKVLLTGEEAVTEVEKRALRQLRENLTDKQILDLGLAIRNKKNPTMLDFSLSNWFSDGNKEGVHKLPINNAAFTLADLTDQQDGKVCSCKAAEADLLLESVVDSDFLSFAAPGVSLPKGYGTGDEDRATQFLTNQAMLKSTPWKTRQDALRGTAMGRASGDIKTAFQDLGDAVAQGIAGESVQQKRAQAAFDSAVDRANRLLEGDD